MKRIKLTIAYDGSRYAGFQVQDNANTVGAELDRALTKLAGHPVHSVGASRTDAGVHAEGQVAAFDLAGTIAPARIPRAAQGILPPDIRILKAEEAAANFHCRYEAQGKWYRYTVATAAISDPFRYRYQWHCARPLEPAAMEAAAAPLLGEHDFRAFCASGSGRTNFVRRIDAIAIAPFPGGFTFDFYGNGFLYKMVRSLTGYLVDVGRGFLSPDLGRELLVSGARDRLGLTAPPQGLCLMKIYYAGDARH